MKYSKEEVMQYVREEDVKFIRLAFCDVFGKQKNISIMPEELPLMHLPSQALAMKTIPICFSIRMQTHLCPCHGDQSMAVWYECSVTLPTQTEKHLNVTPVLF